MENKNIIKKSGLYLIGNLSSKLLTSLLVPIYAFYVSKVDLGQYDYSQTIMNIALPIIFISVWEAIIRFVLSENSNEKKDLAIGTSAAFTLGINILLFLISIILFNSVQIDAIYIIWLIISNSLAQIWQYYSRSLKENKIYVFSSLLGTAINLVMNIVLICVLKQGISALYISFICGQLSIFLMLEFCLKIRRKIRRNNLDYTLLKKMLVYSAPLVINSIAMWLINGFGRTIIVGNLGTGANGLYSFANKFVNIISVFGNVISMAIVEEAMIGLKNKGYDNKFPSTMEALFKLYQSIILVAMPCLVILYLFIAKTEYAVSIYYIPYLMIYAVALTMSTNFGIVFKVIDKNKYQFTTTIIGALVTVVLSYAFIDKIGIYAVLVGQVFGAFSMLVSRYIYINKYVEFKVNWVPIIIKAGVYFILSLLFMRVHYMLNIILTFVCIIYACYDNKEFIRSIIGKRVS